MPRGPHIDALDTLHHVMARGFDRRQIFETTADRRDFLLRLEAVLGATGLRVLTWWRGTRPVTTVSTWSHGAESGGEVRCRRDQIVGWQVFRFPA